MHIAQALAALNLGGSELVAMELTEFAISQGHQSSIIAAGGPLLERVTACGATHVNWAIGRKRLSTLLYIRKLSNWLREQKITVLHAHSRLPAWICWRAIRQLIPRQRPAFVTTMHGHYSVSPYSAVMTRGDRVLAVSDHIRNYTLQNYPRVDPGKVITVHGGIDHDAFPHGYAAGTDWQDKTCRRFPEIEGKRLISLPGRVTRWKGHREFINLVAKIKPLVNNVHGVIIGGITPGSSYQRELLKLSGQMGVAGHITFTGETTQMRDWMAASELVYNLSNNPPEALGRTILEALSLGRPVLAWDHGGAGEILEHLYPRGKVPLMDMDKLLALTIEMLQNPAPVPVARAFGLRESMQKHLAIYQQLAGTRSC